MEDAATRYLCGKESCDLLKVSKTFDALFRGHAYREKSFGRAALNTLLNASPEGCVGPDTLWLRFEDNGSITVHGAEEVWEWSHRRCNAPLSVMLISVQGPTGGAHANALVVDNVHRTVEVFEPHGASGEFAELTYWKVRRLVEQGLFGDGPFTVIRPPQVCPNLGPQALSRDKAGTCMLWSLWFLNLRLQNPWLAAHEAQEEALRLVTGDAATKKAAAKDLRRFIEGFAIALFHRLNPQIVSAENRWSCGHGVDMKERTPDCTQPISVAYVEYDGGGDHGDMVILDGHDAHLLSTELKRPLRKKWIKRSKLIKGHDFSHLRFPPRRKKSKAPL